MARMRVQETLKILGTWLILGFSHAKAPRHLQIPGNVLALACPCRVSKSLWPMGHVPVSSQRLHALPDAARWPLSAHAHAGFPDYFIGQWPGPCVPSGTLHIHTYHLQLVHHQQCLHGWAGMMRCVDPGQQSHVQEFLECLAAGLIPVYHQARGLGVHSILATAVAVLQIYFDENMLEDAQQLEVPRMWGHTVAIVSSCASKPGLRV